METNHRSLSNIEPRLTKKVIELDLVKALRYGTLNFAEASSCRIIEASFKEVMGRHPPRAGAAWVTSRNFPLQLQNAQL